MAKLALYQKYRSTTFDEVVGQEYVVRSIQNAVRENRIGHAYLFCGPRGTGKTTMARILAKAVNCTDRDQAPCGKCNNCLAAMNGTHPDIVEINAANETHVEDIRELIDRSQLAPMMGKHKIYIIDEVHQLSSAASSALLKTLEEPPENVIFVLATTDPQKLLPTIISRCQRFDFTKITKDQIRDHLLEIAEKENIRMESEAAEMIAELSEGGMRDALSIMDQCAAYTADDISMEAIDRIYGLTSSDEKVDLLCDMFDQKIPEVLARIENYKQRGIDLSRFTDALINVLKETVIYKTTKREDLLKIIHAEQAIRIFEHADLDVCMSTADMFLKTKERFRFSSDAATVFEITCLKLAVGVQEKQEVKNVPVRTSKPADVAMQAYEKPVSRETVQTPVMEQKPQEKPVEVVTEKIRELSEDEILSILVQCNKQEKTADENIFARLSEYATMDNRKYISMLEGVRIAASGKDVILLSGGLQAVINRINSEKTNQEIYTFLKDTLHTDKIVFAISEQQFKDATASFICRRKENTLPEPMRIRKYDEQVEHEETVEDRVINLFGKENVEII